MTNISKIVDSINSSEETKNIIQEAKNRYGDKTFTEEYKTIFKRVKRFSFIPSVISCISSSMVALIALKGISVWVALAVGMAFTSMLEAAKIEVSSMGFRSYFRKQKSMGVFLLVALAYALSVFLSVYGSYNAFTALKDDKVLQVSVMGNNALDSIKNTYTAMIENAQASAEKFKESSSWKGKLSTKNQNRYFELLGRANVIADEMNEKIKGEEMKMDNNKKASSKDLQPYLFVMLGFSLLVEFTIFLLSRFKEYYLYKSNNESEALNSATMFNIDSNSLQSILKTFAGHTSNQGEVLQTIYAALQSEQGGSDNADSEGTSWKDW